MHGKCLGNGNTSVAIVAIMHGACLSHVKKHGCNYAWGILKSFQGMHDSKKTMNATMHVIHLSNLRTWLQPCMDMSSNRCTNNCCNHACDLAR